MNTNVQTPLSVKENPDGKLDIKGLAIWSSGKYHGYGSPPEGDIYTDSDLDEMIKAHEEIGSNLRPRMYAGHPVNPWLKMLARPKGEITRLYRQGSTLMADLKGVDKDFWAKATADGARLSPDLKLRHRDHRKNQVYPLAVVGLGVLGATQPANNGLPALDEYRVTHYADGAQERAYAGGEVRSYATDITLGNYAQKTQLSELERLADVRKRVSAAMQPQARTNAATDSSGDSETEFVPCFNFPLV